MEKTLDSAIPTILNNGYDAVGQLTSSVVSNYSTSAVIHQYYYNYDVDGNRTSKQIDSNVNQEASNNLNQLTSVSAGGPTRFQGTVSQPSTVTVNGQPAMQSTSTNFVSNPSLSSGTNTVNVVALNGNNVAQTNSYQVVVPAQATVSPTYDADGNMTNNGNGQAYAWDAENRLITITYTGGATSNFAYDALGRRASIIEKDGTGTVTSTKQFVFCGMTPCEERDSTGTTVTTRLYPQGEQISGTNYYFTKDHQGSVREMTNSSGAVVAQYDYDPNGNVTLVSGSNLADVQFCSYYAHQPSGLNLTMYRAYNPNTARWLNRDPIAENGGINLYDYCGNDPIDCIDSLGLFSQRLQVPEGTPLETQAGQDQAWQDYQKALQANPNEPLDVAGYSRGTQAANSFANRAGNSGHCVRHLILIDPVSIYFGTPAHLHVPASVQQADNYYQTSGGPFKGGAADTAPNVTNHDVSGPGVDHNTVVSRVTGF